MARTQAELTILKNWHGSNGVSIDLELEGRLQRFTNRWGYIEARMPAWIKSS